jgi:hypothetical protein
MPFSVEIKNFNFQAYIDETSFMIEEINEWPEEALTQEKVLYQK